MDDTSATGESVLAYETGVILLGRDVDQQGSCSEWRQAMARAFSGVLGSLAMCLVISRGLLLGLPTDDCLTQSLVVFFGFAAIGFCIGKIAERTVCESVENRFRSEMAKLHTAAASETNDAKDQ